MDPSSHLPVVRIFVSSPGDVKKERLKAEEIFNRLKMEFSGQLQIAPYFWEHEPMEANSDFQSQIELPSKFDIFVCLLWSRLGSRLYPGTYKKPDGSPYRSGTEFELLDALEAWRKSKAPEVFIYRQDAAPPLDAYDAKRARDSLDQFEALQGFIKELTQKEGYYVVATNKYSGLDDFEVKFENHMRKKLHQRLPPGVAGSRSIPKTWTTGSPFRGLLHFDFEHAPIFFGRTRDINNVLDALTRQAQKGRAFVLVFGGSGVGKSSLVRAGVLPWLVRPGVIDGVAFWRRAVIRPGDASDGDLFDALARAFFQPEALPELGADGTSVAQVAQMLRSTPAGVGMLIKGALSQAAHALAAALKHQPRALFALVIDQFEELFTVARFADHREEFLQAVDALARSGYVWVLATLRSDFYPRCEQSPTLMKLKEGDSQYHLSPPDAVQISQMIRLPASAAGLLFEEDHTTSGRRLDDVLRDATVKNPAALPLLEFALEELFLQQDKEQGLLRLGAYDAMGGVEGALGKRAEESFQEISAVAQQTFPRVFRKLVTLSVHEDQPVVRLRAVKDEICTDPASQELVDHFIGRRLLTADHVTDNDGGRIVVSLTHEALLKGWPRLKEWIDSDRENLKVHAEVSADTQRWIHSGRNPDYLCAPGLPLDQARRTLDADFLSTEEHDFVHASLRKVMCEQFEESLATGIHMLETQQQLQAAYPDLGQKAFLAALRSENEIVRTNSATLLGSAPANEFTRMLVELVLTDPHPAVRRAAAASLVQKNDPASFDELIECLRREGDVQTFHALSIVRAAADIAGKPNCCEDRFAILGALQRFRIRLHTVRERFKWSWATLAVTVIPAIALSSLFAALFKMFPAALNYALCQVVASAPQGLFDAVLACFIWGGFISFFIVLHHITLRREHGEKSYLRPWTTLLAGAIGGALSSAIIVGVMTLVCDTHVTTGLGWTTADRHVQPNLFWNDVLWNTRGAWPYMIMGTGLGIGMAMMANGVWASKEWGFFLAQQSLLTGKGLVTLLKSLLKLLVCYAWPIPLAMLMADLLAFVVVRTAPKAVATPAWMNTWSAAILGGLSTNPQRLQEWKMTASGLGLAIFFDSATQALGGFFCLVGISLGLIIIRHGMKIEPRKSEA